MALTVGQQVLLACLGAYRIVRLLQSTAGGVSSGAANGHSNESESTQLFGQERFTLVWVTRYAYLYLLIGFFCPTLARCSSFSRARFMLTTKRARWVN